MRVPAGFLGALAIVQALAAPGCSPTLPAREPAPSRAPRFEEVARAAGIEHRHRRPVLDPKLANIMPWMSSVGAAAAAGDFDGDGKIDLYVTTSHKGEANRLYRNTGHGSFEDVATAAGLAQVNGEDGVSMAAVWGDVDGDGDADLYLVRWGRNALFRNDGGGAFTEITARVFRRRDGTPGTDWANGNAALFLDFDLDGRLDIYVGNYFQEFDLWHLAHTRIMHDDFERARNGGRNSLFRQQPDGTFVDVAASLGVDDSGWTLAVAAGDVNNDGLPDLYCANDFGPDRLYLGKSGGRFENVSATALGDDTKKGMNADLGDYNNDGWLDIYVTNITTSEYLQEGNMLWHNNGNLPGFGFSMTDVAAQTHTDNGGWGWGGKFFDADNDGDLDIFTVNGFVSAGEGNYWYDLASWTVTDSDPADARSWPAMGDRSFSGYEPSRLYVNTGRDSFVEQASLSGIDDDRDGRGLVVFDYDDDGDLDLYVANQDAEPCLYRNAGSPGRHWIGFRLATDPATGVNRDGIGTRVTLVTSAGRQIRERDGGNGYAGQSDPRLHFGLGDDARVELVEVRWPDGGVQYLEAPPVDRWLTVRQDPRAYAAKLDLDHPGPEIRRAPASAASTAPRYAPQDLERLLAGVERELRERPADHGLAGRYRRLCATNDAHDRAIAFLERLADERPHELELRVEYANAFVDKLPTCGGIAAIVCKGTLARKALDQLDAVLAERPEMWAALWSRGMNHLHWPRALRHSDDAVADLRRCVELQARGTAPPLARAHVALGDALAKSGEIPLARRAWQEGLSQHPENAELARRLALTGERELLQQVESARSLEQPIDTDLGFLQPGR
jgi:hypothetical protein